MKAPPRAPRVQDAGDRREGHGHTSGDGSGRGGSGECNGRTTPRRRERSDRDRDRERADRIKRRQEKKKKKKEASREAGTLKTHTRGESSVVLDAEEAALLAAIAPRGHIVRR